MANDTSNEKIKQIIMSTIEESKPENLNQLISQIQEHHPISTEQIQKKVIELENENRLQLTKQDSLVFPSLNAYLFSPQVSWYWVTIVIGLAVTLSIFVIPASFYPKVYLCTALGMPFLLLLPGYSLLELLFPTSVKKKLTVCNEPSAKMNSCTLDKIERVAVSVGISIVLVPIVGLILNYTPWGIRLIPITLSLLALTVLFATAAIMRGYQKNNSTEKNQ